MTHYIRIVDHAEDQALTSPSASSGSDQQSVRFWADDLTTHMCLNCRRGFSTIERRHHCRRCGQIFCHACSKYNAWLHPNDICPGTPNCRINLRQPQRVCVSCATTLRTARMNTLPVMLHSQEYREGMPFQVFEFTVPCGIAQQRLLQVSVGQVIVDNTLVRRIATVYIPPTIHAGDRVQFKVPTGHFSRAAVTSGQQHPILVSGIVQQGELHILRSEEIAFDQNNARGVVLTRHPAGAGVIGGAAVSATTAAPISEQTGTATAGPVRFTQSLGASSLASERADDGEGGDADFDESRDGFLACPACTYHNRITHSKCRMCQTSLVDA